MSLSTLIALTAIAGCAGYTESVPINVPRTVECTFDCPKDQAITEPTITIQRTNEKRKGLYVYQVTLQAPGHGEIIEMVSGRPWKQDTNEEHIADVGAPIPKGTYSVNPTIIKAPTEKFGSIFIAIEPLFQTARYDLGLHHEQEFTVGGKELGTMGCLATMTESDKEKLIAFIRTYQPTTLTVS